MTQNEIIQKRYPFYNEDISTKDIEINAEAAKQLMEDYRNDQLKELQHHKDTTVGLWAIDFDPKDLINRFISSQSDACSLVVEDADSLREDWEKFIDNKNYNKSPFFQIQC